MLSAYDLAILNGVCESACALRPHEWSAKGIIIYDDPERLTVSLAEDYQCVKVMLHGSECQRFDDWLTACQERCRVHDRLRSKRSAEGLDDWIVFKARP